MTLHQIDWTRKYGLTDNKRGKVISLRVTYPTTPGQYPVVIFSHGAGNSKEGYRFLVRHWARAGYICLQPTHEDFADLIKAKFNPPDPMAYALQCAGNPVYWQSRVDDIEHIMANFAQIATQLPTGVTIDEKNVAMTGHSFGAFTAQLFAGATPDVQTGIIPGKSGITSFANPLPRAYIFLSPQGVNTPGLGMPNTAAWAAMTAPFLVQTGSLDNGLQGQTARWRTEPYLHAPAGDKYLAFIDGADHMTCAGKPVAANAAPGTIDHFSYIARVTLSFLDAHIKGDKTAKQSLIDHDLDKESQGVVEQDHK